MPQHCEIYENGMQMVNTFTVVRLPTESTAHTDNENRDVRESSINNPHESASAQRFFF